MPSNKTEAVLFLTENEKADPKMGVNYTPEGGCFFRIVKIQLFCLFITQLVKSYSNGIYMREWRISCRLFCIQNEQYLVAEI